LCLGWSIGMTQIHAPESNGVNRRRSYFSFSNCHGIPFWSLRFDLVNRSMSVGEVS
jgi:hypothetical protein